MAFLNEKVTADTKANVITAEFWRHYVPVAGQKAAKTSSSRFRDGQDHAADRLLTYFLQVV